MQSRIRCHGVGHVQPDPRWHVKANKHVNHEMIVVLRGRIQVTAAGETVQAATGDVLLYPAGVVHAEQTDPSDPLESLFCSFTAPRLQGTRVRVVHDYDGRMRQIIRWLHADQTARDAIAREAYQLLFQSLLAEFIRPNRRPESPMADALRNYVQSRVETKIRVATLAARAGMSRFHFIRRYRQQTGRTPMEEVRRMRLDCARDLLLTTSLPLKEIARRCGLGSAQAFSRIFAAQLGQAPASFRRAHQG